MSRITRALAMALIGLALFPRPVMAAEADERGDLGFFRILDEGRQVVFETGLEVNPGDRLIKEDNRLYEIVSVDGDEATAKLIERVKLGISPLQEFREMIGGARLALSAAAGRPVTVGIYHTHSDESYVPSDGRASIPANGGIFRVGEAFKEALERKGLTVIQDKTPHDPHDSGAYDRSRRTAVRLMEQHTASMLFDVHRDTTPRSAYEKTIGHQRVTQVMLVVGRQNPAAEASLAYAKRIKLEADRIRPGLVRAIFMAKGKYNQDLSPRNILVEVGSHTNDREDAERGIALFAEVVPTLARIEGFEPRAESRGGAAALWFVLALVVVGGFGYLLVATGGVKEARRKLARFSGREWANFLGARGRRRPDEGGEE